MSRRLRVVLVAVAVLLVLGSVAAGVRIADVGTPAPEPTVDTDQPPRAVVQDAGRVLAVTDHRLVTRVHVRDPNASGGRYHAATYRHVREYSDRQHLAVYWTHRRILAGDDDSVPTQFHTLTAFIHAGSVRGPGTTMLYATDGGVTSEFSIEGADSAPGAGTPAFRSPRRTADLDRVERHEIFGDIFLPHDATWRVTDRTDDTITYGIDDPYAQFEVRPTWGVGDILNGSRITVTVDRETGRLERISEERVLVYEVTRERAAPRERTAERRVHFVVETEINRYGTAEVTRPAGGGASWQQLLADLLHY